MKVVVLAGGISTERDVSLSSGVMIYRALKEKGHDAVLLDVYLGYREAEWENDADAAEIFAPGRDWAKDIGAVSEENPDIEQIKALRPDGEKNFFGPNVIRICQAADVVFLALHGENGENGKVQACFDLMGIRYTGTDYVSSALAMDKGLSQELFVCHGIPTPKSVSKPVYGTIHNSSVPPLWIRSLPLKRRRLYRPQLQKNPYRLRNRRPPLLWRRQKHPSVPGGGRPSTRVRSRRLIFRQPRIIFINYKEETNHGTYEKGIERSGSSARQRDCGPDRWSWCRRYRPGTGR